VSDPNYSDELLNAFVDDQLDAGEKSCVFGAMEQDDALKSAVCELRGLKEMTRHAYQNLPSSKLPALKRHPVREIQALAACLFLLVIGGVSGWLISSLTGSGDFVHLYQAISRNDSGVSPSKIMVYVGNADPVRVKTALDESESLLATAGQGNREIRVEIIANESGVNMLRAGVSHYAARIAEMQAKYPNLSLVACTQTLNKLKKKGIEVRLLPNIKSVSSAMEEIKRRLEEGWDYVRV
jgi:intracellular sulfur oxidation DsrE/DsrF family protein